MTVEKKAIADNTSAALLRTFPDRKLSAEELAPYANYSSYRLRDFARAGVITACRRDPARHGAWVFRPAAALAEIEAAHKAVKARIYVRKSPKSSY